MLSRLWWRIRAALVRRGLATPTLPAGIQPGDRLYAFIGDQAYEKVDGAWVEAMPAPPDGVEVPD